MLKRIDIRLKEYDYHSPAAYFFTLCSWQKRCLFGEIINGQMCLNPNGKIITEEWEKTAEVRQNVELDEFIVMPNHVHGILILKPSPLGRRGEAMPRPPKPSRAGSLGTILGQIKSHSTRRINELLSPPKLPVFQRNYFEHIIRSEKELAQTREYIQNNPAAWFEDSDNPKNSGFVQTFNGDGRGIASPQRPK